jgi:hypothetical protein
MNIVNYNSEKFIWMILFLKISITHTQQLEANEFLHEKVAGIELKGLSH